MGERKWLQLGAELTAKSGSLRGQHTVIRILNLTFFMFRGFELLLTDCMQTRDLVASLDHRQLLFSTS